MRAHTQFLTAGVRGLPRNGCGESSGSHLIFCAAGLNSFFAVTVCFMDGLGWGVLGARNTNGERD